MPLKGDAKEVMQSMKDQYGSEEGERVFYATANKQNRDPETWEKESSFRKIAGIPGALTGALSGIARRPAAAGAALGAGLGLLKGDDPADAAKKGLIGAGVGAGLGAGAGMAHRAIRQPTDPHADMPKVAKVPGGMADTARGRTELREQARTSPGQYGAQLRKGTREELEHTNDHDVARDIAKDHMVEDPEYYTKLEKMEKKSVFTPVKPRG